MSEEEIIKGTKTAIDLFTMCQLKEDIYIGNPTYFKTALQRNFRFI